jgi:metallo-beta-lactamase class B
MQKLFFVLLAVLIQFSGFSQWNYETIKVSDDIELIKISENAYVHVSYSNVPGYGRVASNGY